MKDLFWPDWTPSAVVEIVATVLLLQREGKEEASFLLDCLASDIERGITLKGSFSNPRMDDLRA